MNKQGRKTCETAGFKRFKLVEIVEALNCSKRADMIPPSVQLLQRCCAAKASHLETFGLPNYYAGLPKLSKQTPQTFVTLSGRFTLHISIFTDLNCLEGLLLLDFAQMFDSENQVACPLVKVDAILTHSIQSSGSTAITPGVKIRHLKGQTNQYRKFQTTMT